MKVAWFLSLVGLVACGGQTVSTDPSSQTAQADTVTTSDASAPPFHGRHHGPPPEALAACASKAAGAACSVTFHDDSITGTCAAPPFDAGAALACRPDKMPEHGHGPGAGGHPHGPPPEAIFTACEGKAADATCSVTLHDHTVDGTCKAPPEGTTETRLGCRPAHPPHP